VGKVCAELSMSLDGFVAYPDDNPGPVFDWYASGPVEITTAKPELTFHVSEASAKHIRENWPQIGCHIVGRRLFDITDGWGGRHPVDAPVVVVTHRGEPAEWRARFPDAPFTFVDDLEKGVAAAKEIAGDKNISVAGPSLIQQAVNLGLMDEITVSLAPVLMGKGISYFGALDTDAVKLSDPTIVQGNGVTHLTYDVVR
jgi:dihydrofolate reductase